MPADEGWSVVAGRRSDDLFGKVPENKLKSTATVALLFGPQDQQWDIASLRDLAADGGELVFCPIPD